MRKDSPRITRFPDRTITRCRHWSSSEHVVAKSNSVPRADLGQKPATQATSAAISARCFMSTILQCHAPHSLCRKLQPLNVDDQKQLGISPLGFAGLQGVSTTYRAHPFESAVGSCPQSGKGSGGGFSPLKRKKSVNAGSLISTSPSSLASAASTHPTSTGGFSSKSQSRVNCGITDVHDAILIGITTDECKGRLSDGDAIRRACVRSIDILVIAVLGDSRTRHTDRRPERCGCEYSQFSYCLRI